MRPWPSRNTFARQLRLRRQLRSTPRTRRPLPRLARSGTGRTPSGTRCRSSRTCRPSGTEWWARCRSSWWGARSCCCGSRPGRGCRGSCRRRPRCAPGIWRARGWSPSMRARRRRCRWRGVAIGLSTLGAAGLFPSFAAAIFAVEVIHFFAQRRWGIRLSGGAPDVVVRSFAAMLPATVCVVVVWLLVHVLGVDLVGGIAALFRPLVHGGDTLAAVLLVVLIDSALWMVGVHGLAVLAAVRPLWLSALAENMAAVSTGHPPPHVFTQEFFVWFVWQGGSGATLALALLLIFAKSKQLRLVGRAGVVPAIFNINEPLIFGTPVVMNGKLAPPFVLVPAVTVTLTWLAMHFGLVRPPYIEVVWTLPAPIGAYLSSGGDVRAVVLQMLNLAIALALWWPFVRRYDRALLSSERTTP